MRLAALALVLLAAGCYAGPAPEKTSQSGLSPAKREARPTTVSYPNGGALVADPRSCNVTRVHETVRWTHAFASCDNVLEIAIGPDSIAAVRTATAVVGLGMDGNEAWRVATAAVAPALITPTATRDSLVVVALSPQLVVAYRRGQEVWRVVLPATDALVTAPLGNQTEGVLLTTVRGVRAVGADGTGRWAGVFETPIKTD